jgi:hypothetical protein
VDAAMSWQPIETALKNSDAPILVYQPGEYLEHRMTIAWFGNGVWNSIYDDGWDWNPTHWMPLPEPPLSDQG